MNEEMIIEKMEREIIRLEQQLESCQPVINNLKVTINKKLKNIKDLIEEIELELRSV